MEKTDVLNLDDQVARLGADIYVSRLEVEHWPGGVDAMLNEKFESIREHFIKTAKDAITTRGWVAK